MKDFLSIGDINSKYGKPSINENMKAFINDSDLEIIHILHYKEAPCFIVEVHEKKKKKD